MFLVGGSWLLIFQSDEFLHACYRSLGFSDDQFVIVVWYVSCFGIFLCFNNIKQVYINTLYPHGSDLVLKGFIVLFSRRWMSLNAEFSSRRSPNPLSIFVFFFFWYCPFLAEIWSYVIWSFKILDDGKPHCLGSLFAYNIPFEKIWIEAVWGFWE